MSKDELIHLVCVRISQMDDEAHYVYDAERGIIEKYVRGGVVDYLVL